MDNIYLNTSSVEDCKLISLPLVNLTSGTITSLNNSSEIPFDIRRVYYLYDVPAGAERGGHAHKELYQLIVAASGSFDVLIDDGRIKRTINLNRPFSGLLIVPGIWRELINFSSGSICLVMASHFYDENDYLRKYHDYLSYK
jgi:hypothetical protein